MKRLDDAEVRVAGLMGERRLLGARAIGIATLFMLSWLVTYIKSYMVGDDVVHLASPYGKMILLPDIKPGWIPNRAVDMYGRNLIARLFDAIYFPSKSLFNADFFYVYKIFNATIFALFLCIVFGYVYRQAEGSREGGGIGRIIFLALAIATLFPWINQVHFICYQMPGFISFVVLAELLKLMPAFSLRATLRPATLFTLAFIASFSVESNSAIILGVIATATAANAALFRRSSWDKDLMVLLSSTAAFCLSALAIAIIYAQRPKATEKRPAAGMILAFVWKNGSLDGHAKMYASFMLIAVAGLIALCLYASLYRLRNRLRWAVITNGSPTLAWSLFTFIALIPTTLVAGIASLETKRDYFTPRVYPWGGFLIIEALFFIVTVTLAYENVFRQSRLAEYMKSLVLMVILSASSIHYLSHIAAHENESDQILKAYRAAQEGLASYDTGLDLSRVPMSIRPLPTEQSPDWFRSYYRDFFKKYYSTEMATSFK